MLHNFYTSGDMTTAFILLNISISYWNKYKYKYKYVGKIYIYIRMMCRRSILLLCSLYLRLLRHCNYQHETRIQYFSTSFRECAQMKEVRS